MRFVPCVVCLLLFGAVPGLAGGPTVHEVSGEATFAEGTLESLSLGADGILRPGPAFDATPLDVPTAWSALATADALWIGTGNRGQVLRVRAGGAKQAIATGETLMVTALAPLPEGAVAAAAFPGGRVLRIDAAGAVTTLATIPAEHVWALAPDGRGGLVAATGLPGALFRVDAFGAVEKVVEVGDEHARCLAKVGDAWWVGTAPRGLVVSVTGEKASVVRDLEAQEVVGLVPLGERGVLIAANADQAGGNAQMLGGLLQQMLNPPETKNGQEAPPRQALQDGSVVWLDPTGAVTTLWEAQKVAALSLVPDGDGAVLGTYPSGRLFRVEPLRPHALWADFPEAEASVVVPGPGGVAAVVTSNPAVLHFRQRGAARGTWTSKPLDAGATSRWGRLEVAGAGVKGVEFRAGETEEPDGQWGAWKPVDGFDGSGGGTGASARFLQLRATLEGDRAELRALSLVGAAPNRAPVIESLEAKRQGEADAASTLWTVSWKASDPDGDRLEVELHAQRDGSPRWIPLVEKKVLDGSESKWDTAGLPDGVYRMRLRLSDAPDTPPERARGAEAFSAPLRVDNTAPQVTVRARLAGDRMLVEGEATDQPGGRVALIRVSVDGGPWRVVSATDGLLDEAREAFEAALESPGSGAHDVVVQARDAQGNVGAGATVLTVR